ncbi:hypothetical protein K458DRAFT_398179 [Lentithecium fluviatile CBS 122367]|uniref:Uncharacterized protein n=1 Tax=Lentithecium fluviatile CBS 122367 TaxID=1168545 RepID=A0A6G1JMP9_9PLEO|nr:hypothetical protein K458DRAFT_398179 [Lentithecium fluviatile CBS 122367]
MCNGSSSRVSQGGSIAVLRSTSPAHQSDAREDMRLLFSNSTQALLGRAGTQVEFQGWETSGYTISRDRCWVVIHRDGDLSTLTTPPLSESIPFFSFSLENNSVSVMQLPQTLDLGVGDSGIIGRRVSVMTSSRAGPRTVAEGVIGWN